MRWIHALSLGIALLLAVVGGWMGPVCLIWLVIAILRVTAERSIIPGDMGTERGLDTLWMSIICAAFLAISVALIRIAVRVGAFRQPGVSVGFWAKEGDTPRGAFFVLRLAFLGAALASTWILAIPRAQQGYRELREARNAFIAKKLDAELSKIPKYYLDPKRPPRSIDEQKQNWDDEQVNWLVGSPPRDTQAWLDGLAEYGRELTSTVENIKAACDRYAPYAFTGPNDNGAAILSKHFSFASPKARRLQEGRETSGGKPLDFPPLQIRYDCPPPPYYLSKRPDYSSLFPEEYSKNLQETIQSFEKDFYAFQDERKTFREKLATLDEQVVAVGRLRASLPVDEIWNEPRKALDCYFDYVLRIKPLFFARDSCDRLQEISAATFRDPSNIDVVWDEVLNSALTVADEDELKERYKPAISKVREEIVEYLRLERRDFVWLLDEAPNHKVRAKIRLNLINFYEKDLTPLYLYNKAVETIPLQTLTYLDPARDSLTASPEFHFVAQEKKEQPKDKKGTDPGKSEQPKKGTEAGKGKNGKGNATVPPDEASVQISRKLSERWKDIFKAHVDMQSKLKLLQRKNTALARATSRRVVALAIEELNQQFIPTLIKECDKAPSEADLTSLRGFRGDGKSPFPRAWDPKAIMEPLKSRISAKWAVLPAGFKEGEKSVTEAIEQAWYSYFDEFLGENWRIGVYDPLLTYPGKGTPSGRGAAEVETHLIGKIHEEWGRFYEGLSRHLVKIRGEAEDAEDWKQSAPGTKRAKIKAYYYDHGVLEQASRAIAYATPRAGQGFPTKIPVDRKANVNDDKIEDYRKDYFAHVDRFRTVIDEIARDYGSRKDPGKERIEEVFHWWNLYFSGEGVKGWPNPAEADQETRRSFRGPASFDVIEIQKYLSDLDARIPSAGLKDAWAKLDLTSRAFLLESLKLSREEAIQRFGYLDGARELIDYVYPDNKGSPIRGGQNN